MHPHHAFFEDAASVCVEHIMVLAPKERLSEPRGWAVIKPDDLRSGNHHRIGVSILFHGNQEGPADVWPGGTELVASSGSGIIETGPLAQAHCPKMPRMHL